MLPRLAVFIWALIFVPAVPGWAQERPSDGVEWGSQKWEKPVPGPQEGFKDGPELRRGKPGCPCHSHLAQDPGDGTWCPPWANCPNEETTLEEVIPLHITIKVRIPEITVIADLTNVFDANGFPRIDPYDDDLFGGGGQKASQKSSYFGGDGGSGSVDDSDTPILVGPELAYPLKQDLSEWEMTGWLPQGTSLEIYGRALFGKLEIFQFESDLELYSVGLGISVPLVKPPPVSLAATLAAGATRH